jgi:hypothetical protein
MNMIQENLGAPVGRGELGVLLARAGVGKTACLTHIALEHLLHGFPVLHVCIDEIPEKIKVWYHEFLKNIVVTHPMHDLAKLQHRIEPLRFILAYLHHTFSPEKLEQSLQNLRDQAQFRPAMVVMDGLDFDHVSRSTIEALRDFARKHEVSMWMSARTHRHKSVANEHGIPYPCNEIDDLLHTILLLEPAPSAIQLKVLKQGDRYSPELPVLFLNPQTYLMQL